MDDPADPPEGTKDYHWVSVREVLAFISSGLLEEFPPIVLDRDEVTTEDDAESLGLVPVLLPWWEPPRPEGPLFAYHAGLFEPETYEPHPTAEKVGQTCVAINLTHRLNQDEGMRLLDGCMDGSIAEQILRDVDGMAEKFAVAQPMATELGPIWLERWEGHY